MDFVPTASKPASTVTLYALPLFILGLTLQLTACGNEASLDVEPKYAVPVETSLVIQGDVSSFYSTTATLEAPEEARVVSRISGLIEAIKVEEGDKVIAGQLLAVIDAKRQRYELARAEAEVSIIEQELNRLKLMENKAYFSAESMAKLEYNLQAATAKRGLAALQVAESQIRSPIDGVIAMRFVKTGNMAKEFDELFYVVNQDELYGIVYLPEQQLQSLKLGQDAQLFLNASMNSSSGRVHAQGSIHAKVLRISPVVNASSGTFKVTLAVPNPDAKLKAGMFTRVELRYDTHTNVITAPYNAIINQDNQFALYVIDDTMAEITHQTPASALTDTHMSEGDDSVSAVSDADATEDAGIRVSRRQVTLGYREGDRVEILSGINPGEQIVIRGQQNLKDRSLVEIITSLDIASAQK